MKLSDFRIWKFDKTRLENFSDAVFAIIMTLLVLEIKIDDKMESASIKTSYELWQYLKSLSPTFGSWLVSFILLGVFWRNHHCIFKMSTDCDYTLVWINILFLLLISFVPYPAHLMAKYPDILLAVASLGIVMFLSSAVMAWMYYYIVENYLSPEYDQTNARKNVVKAVFGAPLIYGISTGLACAFPQWAFAFYLLIPIPFFLPLDKPKSFYKKDGESSRV